MAQSKEAPPPLRIGFIGSGFIAKFHAKSFQSVRHAQITGVFSPNPAHRQALADAVNAAELGPCRAHADLDSLLAADDIELTVNSSRLLGSEASIQAFGGFANQIETCGRILYALARGRISRLQTHQKSHCLVSAG